MTLSRRRFLSAAALPSLSAGFAAARERLPNVVVILADDQGWGDLSLHGNKNLSTPHIDSLGRDGAQFDRFFVCPVCAPTRAEFLTGRYHPRGGVRGVSTGAERMDPGERTIAQYFRAAGYATGIFGKWHNGTQPPYHPNYRGFEEFYGFTSGHWGQYFSPELDHNGTLVRGKGYITDDLTDRAIDFIGKHRSRPFLCYLPLNTPHSPMQVPDRFYEKFAQGELPMRAAQPQQEDLAHTRAALAMCENIDWNVGRLLGKLAEWKLAQDTIVIYFSDNGPNGWRWNGAMKGRKGTVDEGGVRVPFLIRWPGRITPGTKIPQIAGAIDILPTLAEMTGVTLDQKIALDGKSLRPLLLGDSTSWPDRMIFSKQNQRVSVRTQRWRLDADGKLFDMTADPNQTRDVAAANPAEHARLSKAVADWKAEMLPLTGPDDRPFPVGHGRTTFLPARDGVPHGGVKRSAAAPNDSYFTNWTQKDDRITWDIAVEKAGNYRAELHYTCPAADAGSQIRLSFAGKNLDAKISEAHDPPLEGKEHDRHDRGPESYVKQFRRMVLGTISLSSSRGLLTLQATSIPGKQVADLRYLVLHRM